MSRGKRRRFTFLVLFFFVLLKFGTLLLWPDWERPEAPSSTSTVYAEVNKKKSDKKDFPSVKKDPLKPLIEAIKKRQVEMDKKEESLRLEEDKLRLLKGGVEKRFAELTKLRKNVDELVREIKSFNETKTKHLVKVYEAMPMEEAAVRIARLDEQLAVKLLFQMKGKKAGGILGLIEADKAVELSRELAKQKKIEK
jgi:flagellar motility protein MotE (MotC chaperone)